MSSIDVTIKRETKTGGREEGRGRQERRKRRGVEKNRRNGRVRARTLSRTFCAAAVWRSERGMVAFLCRVTMVVFVASQPQVRPKLT